VSEGVPSQKKALAEARRLGIEVKTVNRTGEVRLRGFLSSVPVTANHRRKDSTREIQKLIDLHRKEHPE
jgi:hypothetical protein